METIKLTMIGLGVLGVLALFSIGLSYLLESSDWPWYVMLAILVLILAYAIGNVVVSI